MKAVLDPNHGLRTGRVICQIVLMEIPRDDRRFLMADTGITVQPALEEKVDILQSAVEVAHALGVANPRVALMAATETVKAAMPETVDAQELTRRHERGRCRPAWFRGRYRLTSPTRTTLVTRSGWSAKSWVPRTS